MAPKATNPFKIIMKEGIKQGIKEFILSGKMSEARGLFISACDNYFKALIHAVDLSLFEKIGKIPDSHTERFRILEKENKEPYTLVDSLFNLYRKSYRSSITKEEFNSIKNGLKRTIELTKLEKEFNSYLQEK